MFECLDDVRQFLREFPKSPPYSELEEEWRVNRYYLWNICNKADYAPPLWVLHRLGITRYRRRNRPAVNCDNPTSAAATIRAHGTAEFVAELVKELRK